MIRSIARPSLIGLAMVNAVVRSQKRREHQTPLVKTVVDSLQKKDAGIIHTPSITLNLKD